MPTQIRFDNETSDSRTAVEIETEDRVGLLYTVSLALAELNPRKKELGNLFKPDEFAAKAKLAGQ